jgi:hypothetical protein
MYTYTGRHYRLLATLSKLLIGNGYMAIGCINTKIWQRITIIDTVNNVDVSVNKKRDFYILFLIIEM